MPLSDDSINSLLWLCLEDPSQAHIKICDFSESFIFDSAAPVKRIANAPVVFRDPQSMFANTVLSYPTPATDIWALAVVFNILFTDGCPLFEGRESDEVLCDMVAYLGKLPEPYWTSWENRKLYFDDEGYSVYDRSGLATSFGEFLEDQEIKMDDEARKMFEDMLRRMVVYDPADRIKADELVASQWFVKCCVA